MSKGEKWSLADPWNEAAKSVNRPLVPRSYIFGSEIFGPKIDRYLSMLAVEPSNPPNDRSLRKFFAGKVWEYVVKQVLLVCGVYHQEEIKIDAIPFSGLLPVHSRCDFIAGGYVDKDEAFAKIQEHHLPDILHGIATRAINMWHGKNLEKKILEIKSLSMFAFDYVERRRKPINRHVGQAYNYERNNKEGYEAYIGYVSKDTVLLKEFSLTAAEIEPAYQQDIAQMSYYYMKREAPPLDPLMGFDDSIGSFTKNLNVEYSNYLTMLYGFASPDDYRRNIQPTVLKWNNVLSRYARVENGGTTPTGKIMEISKKNKEVRQEIINSGYDFNELLQIKMQFLNDDSVIEEEN